MCEFSNLKYSNEKDDTETYDLNNNIFDISMKIMNKTKTIKGLGQYQLDIMLTGIINQYDNENIREDIGNNIMSSALYSNFVKWLKFNNVNNELAEYISCVKFVSFFGQKHTQLRTTNGKYWTNVKIITKYDPTDESKTRVNIQLINACSFNMCNEYIKNNEINFDPKKYNINGKFYVDHVLIFDNCCYICEVNRNSFNFDFLRPIKIIVEYDGDYNDIFNSFGVFNVEINGNNVTSLPISKMCMNGHNEIIKNEEFKKEIIIDINNSAYFSNMLTGDIFIKLTTCNNSKLDDVKITVINEYFMCNREIRDNIINIPQITEICNKYLHLGGESQSIIFNLTCANSYEYDYGCIKGFIIKIPFNNNESILCIDDILVKINGLCCFTLNKTLIRTMCKKINNNTLYVPFGDIDINNIYNRVGYDRIDSLKLTLSFNDKQKYDSATVYLDMFGLLFYNKETNEYEINKFVK